MSKIFNKKTIVDVAIFDENKYEKLTEEQLEELNKSTKLNEFPRAIFADYLMDKDFNQLDSALHQLFYNNLPHEIICKNCNDCQIVNNKKPIPEWNCGPTYIEFSVLKTIAAKNLIVLIETNKNVLNKKTIQQLVILFFTNAFEFQNLRSFFKIGEMVKYLTKEGFKEISKQLGQIDDDEAKELISKNYYITNDDIIQQKLDGPGHIDFLKIKKKFWKNELEQLNGKQSFPNNEPNRVTFITTLSELQLKKLFEELIINQIISANTTEDIFLTVFKGEELRKIRTKINWQRANNLLAYFIDAMIREKIITEGNHWNIGEHCFTNSKHLANASLKYKETKTGQPKEAVIINDILKGLY